MKVRDLIEALESYDPDAQVLLCTQSQWPLEAHLAGLTSREEMQGPDAAPPRDGASSDVLLIEGQQVRYGSKAAWQSIGR
jgi:hypothetical protein